MTMQRVMNEMKINAPSIPCGTSLIDVVELFSKHQINAVPVVSAENEVIGFVSESDCMKVVEARKLVGLIRRRDVLQVLARNHNQCGQMG